MRSVRGWSAVTAAVAWASIILQTILTAANASNVDFSFAMRMVNLVSYFTLLSNILVACVATALALNPQRDGPIFRVLRLDSLIMITVTGLVYAIVLAPLWDPQGWQAVADYGLHYAVPLLTVIGWLVAGPRMLWDYGEVFKALIVPVIWLAYTLIRGPIVHWYPYPFLDVDKNGYLAVAINIVAISIIGLLFGFAFRGIEVLLERRRVSAAVESG